MGKFATAVNCIDGRCQEPVIGWAKGKFNVDFVDMINFPGVDGKLLEDKKVQDIIRMCVEISLKKHKSNAVVVCGHWDCAGNPVDENTHKEHIKKSARLIKSWFENIKVVGVWIGKDWSVEEVLSL